jgi:predicted dehydrogenase
MRRRKFFILASSGAAGIALAPSCQGSKKESSQSVVKDIEAQSIGEAPHYREVIKSSFNGGITKSANDTIIVGLIGAGGWGSHLILQVAQAGANIRVKYICDVDDTRGGHAIVELGKIQGFRPIRVRDMRKVFDDKEVDAVFIATPEHWHALATIWACQAGKDVYVEKCISHNIFEGQKMIEAAMQYERVVQCGTLNRSAAEALKAKDYIDSGELGDLVSVHVMGMRHGPIPFNEKEGVKTPDTIDWDMWLGPAPKAPYSVSRHKSWFFYWDYGGGYAMSNAVIHELDLARLILGDPGFPSSVYCMGGRYFFDDNRDAPDYQLATFDYGKYVMYIEAGQCTPYMGTTPDAIRFSNTRFPEWSQSGTRVEILGTKRMMYVGRMGGGWQVFEKDHKIAAQQPALYPLTDHINNFFDCVRSRKQPNANIVEGHKSSVLVHLANLSYRAGCEKLNFSSEYETILNNTKAQEMIYGHYRKGFEIPKKV